MNVSNIEGMTKSNHYDTARLVIGFLAVCLMAGIFFIFYNNGDYIIQSDQFSLFILLTVIAGGLLIGLFYLVSNQTQKVSLRKKKKSSR